MGRIKVFHISLFSVVFFLVACDVKQKKERVAGSTKETIKRLLLLDETSPKCPKNISFDNYPGFRDWYRFPLKFPYHMIMIDSFDTGRLDKFNGGDIRNPNESSETVIGGIKAIIPLDTCLIFRLAETTDTPLYRVFFFMSTENFFRLIPKKKSRIFFRGKQSQFIGSI